MPQETDQMQFASTAIPIGEFLLLTPPTEVDRAYQDDREIELEFDDGQAHRRVKAVFPFNDLADGYRGRTTNPVGFALRVVWKGKEVQYIIIQTKSGH